MILRAGLITLAGIAVVGFALTGLYFWRLRAIGSRVGSFECALLLGDRWFAGIATYTRDHLAWHEVVSLSIQPQRTFDRRELLILARRARRIEERTSQVSEAHCRYRGEEFYLAAPDGAIDGLVSWLEASPPDSRTSRVI
ncbi:DUF2550 family protein [Pseudactinotalea sp. HY158]|uniref:DUF2550 family protein n=1 Tax=Pseudactinotalea sp. HY158 TaxID=2654547 RepID=UPI00129C2AAC|nr:DUF2550 family protein [Pseudactinotalea sp. HY158]QGH68898.1 DUF2550 family protein [Pseudactinotalea sp. HY158]